MRKRPRDNGKRKTRPYLVVGSLLTGVKLLNKEGTAHLLLIFFL